MALGLKHMHDRKILHRDIKGDNVFMNKNETLKLGDFGISNVLAHTASMAKSSIGTPYYMSPELFRSEPYGFSNDIWALGIQLYRMVGLDYPFNSCDGSKKALAVEVINNDVPEIPNCYQ
jgi:NIMA (never in mitosis gene a)-related kinase